jgi:hypothetical protein
VPGISPGEGRLAPHQNDGMSDGAVKRRDSHPVRLAVVMLVGAAIGFTFFRGPGNSLDIVYAVQSYIDALIGAVIGLTFDFCFRPWRTRGSERQIQRATVGRVWIVSAIIGILLFAGTSVLILEFTTPENETPPQWLDRDGKQWLDRHGRMPSSPRPWQKEKGGEKVSGTFFWVASRLCPPKKVPDTFSLFLL